MGEIDGESKVISRLEEGAHFGEIGVLAESPRTLSVRAAPNTTLLKMNARDFHQTFRELPTVRAYFNRYISFLQEKDRLRAAQGK